MSFLDFYLSSNWERESGKRNLGIKENGSKVTYLIFFRRGSTGESFLLSRANRLCSIFLHWLEEPGVLHVSVILLSSTRSKMAMVRPPATNPAQKLISYYLLPLRRRGPHFRFGVPANHLASLSPLLVSGDLRSLNANICLSPLCVYIYIYIYMPVCVCIYIYIYNACVCVYIYIYI